MGHALDRATERHLKELLTSNTFDTQPIGEIEQAIRQIFPIAAAKRGTLDASKAAVCHVRSENELKS
jgi:hypothetical protein